MIFKRKKNDVSSTSIGADEKIGSKAMALYVGLMCFAAACLSFMTLEVGSRSPLGQSVTKSATFNAIFRRSYNMKIKIMITNIVMGLITTIMLALGDIYGIPYLHVPWLFNTMRGMLLYEGPALLGLSYIWLPDAGIPAGTFIFITLLLFVEELCLWFDVLVSLKKCWYEYNEGKNHQRDPMKSLPTDGNEKHCNISEQQKNNNLEPAVANLKIINDESNFGSIVKPINVLVSAKSTFSDANTLLRSTRSSYDSKRSGY